ncbi:NepR family anti-sigma factor [Rhodoblastus acidophilus]|nr:NepR family anti-sigma factor [Rhodoblastus acidophilus]MCW2314791.1 hypothetical protein [Rhodoblastus acidophilus]
MTDDSKDNSEKSSADIGLEPLLQAHIGRKLREFYDSAVREPVPDRFKLLLDQLENDELESVGDKAEGKAEQA